MTDAGRKVDDFLTNAIGDKSVIKSLKVPVPKGAAGAVLAAVPDLWNSLVDGLGTLEDALANKIFGDMRASFNLYRCLFQRYSPGALLGIIAVRGIVSATRHIRLGTDLALWFTADLELALDLLDEFLAKLQRYFAPIDVPAASEVTSAWVLDRISDTQRDCLWRLNGLDPGVYENIALTDQEQLDWREQIQYLRRQGIGEGLQRRALRARGWISEENIDAAMEMYWELPGISDHLHWLQRNVFDAKYVADYQLLDGFDTKFWPKFGPDLTALGMREEYAQYHYAAHWIMPSPEQLARFVYRSDEITAATGRGFTVDDYERVLTEQDYNKLARGWFKATIFQVPPISYLKEWYRQGVINREELASYHRRLGYDPKDAERFTDIDDLQKRRMRAAASHGWTTAAASKAFAQGQLSADDQEQVYAQLGYDREEARQAREVAIAQLQGQIVTRARSRLLSSVVASVRAGLSTGILGQQQATAALSAVGWPQGIAAGIAQLESASARTAVVKQAISYIRRHVLDGSVTLNDAAAELARLGIVPDAVVRYTQVWALQLTPGRKRRSAKDVVNDLATGHITRGQAIARLRALGYANPDSRLYLADAVAKTTKLNEARVKAEESKGLKRNKELLKVAKEIDTQRKSVVKAMRLDQPVAKLDSWLKGGLIGKRYYTERLLQYGYSPNSITARIAEVCAKKGSACVDTQGSVEVNPGAGGG